MFYYGAGFLFFYKGRVCASIHMPVFSDKFPNITVSCFLTHTLSSYQDATMPGIFRPFRAVVSGLADIRGSIKKQIPFYVSRVRNWQYAPQSLSAVFQLIKASLRQTAITDTKNLPSFSQ